MNNLKRKLLSLSMLVACLLVFNIANAQNKLVVVSPSGVHDVAFTKSNTVEIFNIPVSVNPLESIITELKGGNYNELHIYAVTEKNVIVFHGLQLWSEGLYMNKEILEKFKQFKIKIIIHSSVLGSDASGKKLLGELSQLMGNPVEVQK